MTYDCYGIELSRAATAPHLYTRPTGIGRLTDSVRLCFRCSCLEPHPGSAGQSSAGRPTRAP